MVDDYEIAEMEEAIEALCRENRQLTSNGTRLAKFERYAQAHAEYDENRDRFSGISDGEGGFDEEGDYREVQRLRLVALQDL